MDHLDELSVEQLRAALERTSEKTPAKRLIAAIAYKNGVTQSELAEWFDVERKTIYNWFSRLESENLDTAVRDAQRPGRPRKLSPEEFQAFERTVREPPTSVGFEAPAWRVDLARQFLRERFDVEYSSSSCRRLLSEAGLRHRPSGTFEISDLPGDPGEIESAELGHVWIPE